MSTSNNSTFTPLAGSDILSDSMKTINDNFDKIGEISNMVGTSFVAHQAALKEMIDAMTATINSTIATLAARIAALEKDVRDLQNQE